jgi:internalin A
LLDGALREAVDWLLERHGTAEIGIGRLQVQRALQTMRVADAAVSPEQRQYRTITQEHFHRLCDEAVHVSSPEELLRFLHNAGIVFHRPGLFHDSIVLDQGWALDAIYAVLDRKNWRVLTGQSPGRFTRPLLELLVWREHPVAEQKLFLDMMRSCGICFVHRQGPDHDDDSTEYIAPDLLPQRNQVQDDLNARWDVKQPTETAEFEFEMLHPGLVRILICEIGSEAGVAALYWLGGIYFYDKDTGSHALIEQHMQDALRGRISVQTQRGQAQLLLDRLSEWIERQSGRHGLNTTRMSGGTSRRISVENALPGSARPVTDDKLPASPGPVPVAETEYFISFAWGDDKSPEGRGAIVDRLCAEAETRGLRILRDSDILHFGERITLFMRRIGKGDRVFIILSEKYLQSPYCMFELCEMWHYSRGDEADFRRRVCIYTLPGTPGRSPIERTRHAEYWKNQHDELKAAIKKSASETIGVQDFAQFKLMGDFYRHVGDILYTMFDTIQPHSFEELVQFGLEAAPPT